MKELDKHSKLFNFIAPVYNKFFTYQVKKYRGVLDQVFKHTDLPAKGKVLDIGCGTGALLFSFVERGYIGFGVDIAEKMIREARKSTAEYEVDFYQAEVTQGLPFEDKAFELVTSSYVLHGLSSELRKKFYSEAGRLSKGYVMFIDYNQKRSLLTDMAEWAEGGEYFTFIKVAENEMKENFREVKILNVGPSMAVYLCKM